MCICVFEQVLKLCKDESNRACVKKEILSQKLNNVFDGKFKQDFKL